MTRNTYVGPVPLTAVAIATNFSSSTSSWAPSAPSSAAACSRCSSVVSGVAYQTVMPLPSRAGVFGIARMTWSWPSVPVSAAVVAPAMTESTSWPRRRCGPISRPTVPSIWGLIANSTTSASRIASALPGTTRIAYSRSRCSRRSCAGVARDDLGRLDERAPEQAGDHRLGHDAGADGRDRAVREGGHVAEYGTGRGRASTTRCGARAEIGEELSRRRRARPGRRRRARRPARRARCGGGARPHGIRPGPPRPATARCRPRSRAAAAGSVSAASPGDHESDRPRWQGPGRGPRAAASSRRCPADGSASSRFSQARPTHRSPRLADAERWRPSGCPAAVQHEDVPSRSFRRSEPADDVRIRDPGGDRVEVALVGRSQRDDAVGERVAPPRSRADGRTEHEEPAGRRDRDVPEPGLAQRRLELGRLAVDLDDRELPAVVEAADRAVVGRRRVVRGARAPDRAANR